jgi:hypothetical protein
MHYDIWKMVLESWTTTKNSKEKTDWQLYKVVDSNLFGIQTLKVNLT